MAKHSRDENGVCTDFKNRFCGCCTSLRTEKCCRSVPKYQKEIAEWARRCAVVAADVVGIDHAVSVLEERRQTLFDRLSENDYHRVDSLVFDMKQTPGIKVRFIHEGTERSCFECVNCEKILSEDPCRSCLGDRSWRDEVYPSAKNFQPKDRSREVASQELAEKYRHVFDELVRDANSRDVSVYEVLAYMLEGSGEK